MSLNPSVSLQLISCTIGCLGLCFWYNVHGKQFVYNGIGAFMSWAVQVLVHDATGSNFMASFIAAFAVALFSELAARLCRAPSTIFLTTGAFPLVPGASLYNCMYNAVQGRFNTAFGSLFQVVAVAVAIALGFIVVGIFRRYLIFAKRIRRHKKRMRERELKMQRRKLRE